MVLHGVLPNKPNNYTGSDLDMLHRFCVYSSYLDVDLSWNNTLWDVGKISKNYGKS